MSQQSRKCFAFISYSSHDDTGGRVAQGIAEGLKNLGSFDFQVNGTRRNFDGGTKIALRRDMTETYEFIILVLSQSYFNSSACAFEYATALTLRDVKNVIAVIVDGFPVPDERQRSYRDSHLRDLQNLHIRTISVSSQDIHGAVRSLVRTAGLAGR